MKTAVAIADDHPIFLNGLRQLINSEQDFEVVAAVSSGEEAIAEVEQKKPQILISDVSMTGIGGIEATRQVRNSNSAVKILILSMHAEQRYVLAALEAGANGYLLKDTARDELVKAVRTVHTNETYLSPAVANHVVATLKNGKQARHAGLASLTAREREVLCLIASGETTKQIAVCLGLSPKTVATHREHLMSKLDAHSVAALTRIAIREGLISAD